MPHHVTSQILNKAIVNESEYRVKKKYALKVIMFSKKTGWKRIPIKKTVKQYKNVKWSFTADNRKIKQSSYLRIPYHEWSD